MARPREPVDLIAAKGRKHLTIAEYVERKNAEITAPADKVKPPDFLLKKEKEKFDELAKQLVDLKIMTNLDCDVLARYINLRRIKKAWYRQMYRFRNNTHNITIFLKYKIGL